MRPESFNESEIFVQQRFLSAPVAQAATKYVEGKNAAFVAGGTDPSIQDRLCEECPVKVYCGAAVAELTSIYPDNFVPKKDMPTLAERGIDSSPDGYQVCPGRLINNAVAAVRRNIFVVSSTDPLNNSTQGHQAVETVRHVVTNTVQSLKNGLRI